MKEFILASSNSHKAEEFNQLFSGGNIFLQASSQKIEVEESADSFNGNALLKAKAYFDEMKLPSMADDSGLVVRSLPGELGIHSARFGGEGLTASERNDLLLERLKNEKEREAYFVCVLCFYFSADEVYFFEGRCHGEIAEKSSGEQGFGYDPIFLPEGCEGKSLAECPEFKRMKGHRAKAVSSALKFFNH